MTDQDDLGVLCAARIPPAGELRFDELLELARCDTIIAPPVVGKGEKAGRVRGLVDGALLEAEEVRDAASDNGVAGMLDKRGDGVQVLDQAGGADPVSEIVPFPVIAPDVQLGDPFSQGAEMLPESLARERPEVLAILLKRAAHNARQQDDEMRHKL